MTSLESWSSSILDNMWNNMLRLFDTTSWTM